MSVLVRLNQLHIPERCNCIHHQKVFTFSTREAVFIDRATVVKVLERWSKQQGKDSCWVYEITHTEPASPTAEIDFFE